MPCYAAVDIGSNSVRMEVAEVGGDGPPKILASQRQVTRLGASVFRTGRVSEEALSFLCDTLREMSETWKRLHINGLRAVATAAVRDASNQAEFRTRASAALGADVEIISGQEEARLIHLGVQSRWPHPGERFLIIDIGGGSAEIIVSENARMGAAFSKPLGALRLHELFLRNDPPREAELHRLEEFIERGLGAAVRSAGRTRIDRVIGTSATASAVVCAANRIPRTNREDADRREATIGQLRKLYAQVRAMSLEKRQEIVGIGPRRAEIIIPGAAVLLKVLERFNMPSLTYSAAGVRDGIIADLAARGSGGELNRLMPEQRATVEAMTERYGGNLRHTRTISRLANDLFLGLSGLHMLPPHYGRLLEAAACLQDIGRFISETGHHKHSWYVVANSDLAGFTKPELDVIANLCRYHRKAMPTVGHPNLLTLDEGGRRAVDLLTPVLRLASALDRSHGRRVRSVECRVAETEVLVILTVAREADIDLELWAAERLTPIFRQVYGKTLVLART